MEKARAVANAGEENRTRGEAEHAARLPSRTLGSTILFSMATQQRIVAIGSTTLALHLAVKRLCGERKRDSGECGSVTADKTGDRGRNERTRRSER